MSNFKVLHTSDWHLGKKLFKKSRKDDQVFFLDWLLSRIKSDDINLLLIAGDIFDSPTPSNEVQKIFYDFIYKLGQIEKLSTVIITGNHDSSSLFEIPKDFFKLHNCFIYSTFGLDKDRNEFLIHHNDQTIGIKLLPYFRNYELTKHIDITSENENELKEFFQQYFTSWTQDIDHKILMAHHCFGHYSASGSEQAIFLSGLNHFPLDWVSKHFDYIALGHIHKKQELSSSPPIIYPGSPFPLRFSEKSKKVVAEFCITTDGISNLSYIEVPQRTRLVQLNLNLSNYEEKLEELINDLEHETNQYFLEVIMILDDPTTGIQARINQILKNTKVELISYIPNYAIHENEKSLSLEKIEKLGLTPLFKEYYQTRFQQDTTPKELLHSFSQLIEEINHEASPY